MTPDQTGTLTAGCEGAEAAGALHDFNNALQAMAASLRHLERKVSRGEADDLPGLVKALNNQVMRIGRLGAALTCTASAGAGTKVTVFPFLEAMVPQILALLDGNVRLELALEPEAGQVSCDPARLESAVRNLVLNARDAMPGGGVLTVRGSIVTFSQDEEQDGQPLRPGCFAAITIADTGCGMGPEMLRRCFEPFVTTKKGSGGTGLGLFQLRAFAEQAGGTVRIRSQEGEGTEVTILFPCPDPAKPEPGPVALIL